MQTNTNEEIMAELKEVMTASPETRAFESRLEYLQEIFGRQAQNKNLTLDEKVDALKGILANLANSDKEPCRTVRGICAIGSTFHVINAAILADKQLKERLVDSYAQTLSTLGHNTLG